MSDGKRLAEGLWRRETDVGNPLEKSISISLRNDLLSHLWNLEQREGELKGIQLSLGDWFFFLERHSGVEHFNRKPPNKYLGCDDIASKYFQSQGL